MDIVVDNVYNTIVAKKTPASVISTYRGNHNPAVSHRNAA
jgi:hypothetical protein